MKLLKMQIVMISKTQVIWFVFLLRMVFVSMIHSNIYANQLIQHRVINYNRKDNVAK